MGVGAQSSPAIRWHVFADGAELAASLASTVADGLRAGVDARGEALLAVSGGTTPGKFLRALSQQSLPWEKVTVTLVDERFVSAGSDRSNEKMVRESLLRGKASPARFAGLYSETQTVEEAAEKASKSVAAVALPLDVAVLGMGLDGHTASFFPDADNLQALLDPLSQEFVMPVHAASAGEPRLSFSLARLVESGFLALHIEGKAKHDLLRSGLRQPFNDAAPILSVISHAAHPVDVYWAPNEDEIP